MTIQLVSFISTVANVKIMGLLLHLHSNVLSIVHFFKATYMITISNLKKDNCVF